MAECLSQTDCSDCQPRSISLWPRSSETARPASLDGRGLDKQKNKQTKRGIIGPTPIVIGEQRDIVAMA